MGRVEAIWTKRVHGGPMDPHESVRAVEDYGLEDCAGGGRTWRQVTVIEKEVFDRIKQEFPDSDPVMRRANVMVSGVRLEGCVDRILQLGELRLHMRGETRPCQLMDDQCPGLKDALDPNWGAGAFGKVLNDAEIHVGDEVRWTESAAAAD